MELQEIVERYAEAFSSVDALTMLVNVNTRTGVLYPPALKTLREGQAVAAADEVWQELHPDDFVNPNDSRVAVPYLDLPGAVCDHVFTTVEGQLPEWAIEVKNIALVGNNGKRNDFGVAKVLSPYLKDRGMLHDVARLRHYRLARRHAVIGYAFSYDVASCAEALVQHPTAGQTVGEILVVCDANGGSMTIRPLLEFAESILGLRGYLRGSRAQAEFTAWRHPAGGRGLVFGWEIRRPELEPDYDPRHPW